jgi:hypothetical protein
MTPDLAQTLAVKALAWMIGEDDLREVFMGASGASEHDLRAGVSDPVFLGALLDFICMDDAWVTRFCDDVGIANYMDPCWQGRLCPEQN